MTRRRYLTVVAAAAALLAALPLTTVFATMSWFVAAVMVVSGMTGVAVAIRSLRTPSWLATVAMAGSLCGALVLIFPSGDEYARIIPTWATFEHFGALIVDAVRDMRFMSVPVDRSDGLFFLTTLGIGFVAIVVDLCAVVLRRPALAGLPMLAIYSVPVAVQPDSVNMLPFMAAAAGFLWLLGAHHSDRVRQFGRRFSAEGHDISRSRRSPTATAARSLALVGVLIAGVLPTAVPTTASGLLDKLGAPIGGEGDNGSGASINVYALLEGALRQNQNVEMVRVRTNDPAPDYLRFGVADELQPDGFHVSPPQGNQPAATATNPNELPAAGSRREYRASVTTLNYDMSLLPVYLRPTRMDNVDSTWLLDRNSQVIFSRRSTAKQMSYGFDYARSQFTAEALRAAKPLDNDDPNQRRFTRLPRGHAEVEALVAQRTAGKTTPYDKVRAIYDYFSADNGFKYSLETRTGTGGSEIVDFLQNKQGFCQQYSAAMAWLVRAAGIPARVAFGFTRGNNTGDTYTLRSFNLHAWTEVYFGESFGWLPFDPTPAAYIAGAVHPEYAPDPDAPATTDPGGVQPVNGDQPSPAATASVGPNPDRQRPDEGTGSPAHRAASWPRTVALTAGGVLVLLLLALPAWWRIRTRRQRRPAPAARAAAMSLEEKSSVLRRDAHAAWDELVDTLVDHRRPVDDGATPRAVAAQLAQGNLDAPVRLLGQAEERARYAPQPLESAQLAEALRAVRAQIVKQSRWHTRLVAVLAPPSVLQRWRVGYRPPLSGRRRHRSSSRSMIDGRRDRVRRLAVPPTARRSRL